MAHLYNFYETSDLWLIYPWQLLYKSNSPLATIHLTLLSTKRQATPSNEPSHYYSFWQSVGKSTIGRLTRIL